MRRAITNHDRLAVTLEFLVTGDSYTSLQYLFRISKQSISQIIPVVCEALIEVLKENMKIPSSVYERLHIAKKIEDMWNFPHCLGAIDGKHVILQAPQNSGSEFFNYKCFFSIVLLALVDANYNLLYVDVGCQERISDDGVFKNCSLYKKLNRNELGFPRPKPLCGRHKEIPYFFIGDEAFTLTHKFMKVYSRTHLKGSLERIFNYRLCRARRVVENVFGISLSVFRVLRKPLLLFFFPLVLWVTSLHSCLFGASLFISTKDLHLVSFNIWSL
ncbi:hypothetical protein PGB90_000938 [Kerria lacca]